MDETNFMILKQIGDHADDSSIFSVPTLNNSSNNNNNEEIESDSDNELLPKNVIIPEPDEIDTIESEDLFIDPNLVLTQSAEYKRKHFSNTSSESSDSDDSITRGLDFKNIPVTATIEPHTSPSSSAHSLLMNIQQTIARNLIENITTSLDKPKSSQTKVYDDDDSDFEILDSEDIPK
jgi:hypothetical protein